MRPMSLDFKDLLVAEGIGNFGIDLFVGKEPTSPANCVTIYDTGGGEQNSKLAIDESSVQIRSRNLDYLQGYQKLNIIKNFIEGKKPTVVDGTKYIGFWTSSNIAFVKYDDNDRSVWTVNFRINREPAKGETGNRENTGG